MPLCSTSIVSGVSQPDIWQAGLESTRRVIKARSRYNTLVPEVPSRGRRPFDFALLCFQRSGYIRGFQGPLIARRESV